MGIGQKKNWRGTLEERLEAGTRKDPDGCWIWIRAVQGTGYGVIWKEGRNYAVHRLAYEMAHKVVLPYGSAMLQVDHLCRNRRCLNPDHLQLVTPRENTLRGTGPSSANAAKARCPQGHPYSEENTRMDGGKRYCRTCARIRQREYSAGKKAVT